MNTGHKYWSIAILVVVTTIDLLLQSRRRFIPINVCIALTLFKAPDFDKVHGVGHRHWVWHSALISSVFVLSLHELYFISIIWGLHLWCDIPQKWDKRPKGSYNITFRGHYFKPWKTRLYLFLNGIICFALAIFGAWNL